MTRDATVVSLHARSGSPAAPHQDTGRHLEPQRTDPALLDPADDLLVAAAWFAV